MAEPRYKLRIIAAANEMKMLSQQRNVAIFMKSVKTWTYRDTGAPAAASETNQPRQIKGS